MNTKEIDYYALGNRVRELREAMDLTQDVFAELCGATRPTISNIENAKTHASSEVLINIASVCNVSLDYLQYGSRYSQGINYDSMLEGDRDFITSYMKLNKEQKEKMKIMLETFFPEVCIN